MTSDPVLPEHVVEAAARVHYEVDQRGYFAPFPAWTLISENKKAPHRVAARKILRAAVAAGLSADTEVERLRAALRNIIAIEDEKGMYGHWIWPAAKIARDTLAAAALSAEGEER